MSINLESAARLNALKSGIEAKTGERYTDLTDGVNALIAGFGQSGGGIAYDMGEFVLDTDISHGVAIPHALGEKPGFVLIWTDEFADLTADNVSPNYVSLGYIWLDGLTGMMQRLTSVAFNALSVYVAFTLNSDDYRISAASVSSIAYGMKDNLLPTASKIYLCMNGSNVYTYKAGITYKYFVSKGWW